jgi:predicted membrane-bound mannosyltransferase
MKIKTWEILIVIFLFVLACISRLPLLDQYPLGLHQDEAVSGVDAYYIGSTLKDHHGNFLPVLLESYEDWTSPLLTYITVIPVKIFGLSALTLRLTSGVLNVVSVFLLYLLAKRLSKSVNIAFFSALVFCISPYAVNLSRFALPTGALFISLLVSLNLFFLFLDRIKENNVISSIILLFLTSISFSLCVQSYPTMKMYVPMLLVVLCLVYLRKNIKYIMLFATWLVL